MDCCSLFVSSKIKNILIMRPFVCVLSWHVPFFSSHTAFLDIRKTLNHPYRRHGNKHSSLFFDRNVEQASPRVISISIRIIFISDC